MTSFLTAIKVNRRWCNRTLGLWGLTLYSRTDYRDVSAEGGGLRKPPPSNSIPVLHIMECYTPLESASETEKNDVLYMKKF